MKHEKTITKENGDKYQIVVRIYVDTIRSNINAEYRVELWECKKGKRKFINIVHYSYREDNTNELLKYISKEDIFEAKLELWNKLKPE